WAWARIVWWHQWELSRRRSECLKSWIGKLWQGSIIRRSIIILLPWHLAKSGRMPQLSAIVTSDISRIVVVTTKVLLLIALVSIVTLRLWFRRLVLKSGHLCDLFGQMGNCFLEFFGLGLLGHSN